MKQVKYLLPELNKPVPALVVCDNGVSTLLFVPSFNGEIPSFLAVVHDDDFDGVFEDTEANWFNVEPEEMREIADNLQRLSKGLR